MNQLLTEMDGFESNKGVVPGIKKDRQERKHRRMFLMGFHMFFFFAHFLNNSIETSQNYSEDRNITYIIYIVHFEYVTESALETIHEPNLLSMLVALVSNLAAFFLDCLFDV